MKAISNFLFISLLLSSCANNGHSPESVVADTASLVAKSEKSEPQAVAGIENPTPEVEKSAPAPTEDEILQLLYKIPDHQIMEGSKAFMTNDYWKVLSEAWRVPDDALDGIGSNEFLYYFMTGNGGANGLLASVQDMKVVGNKCAITLNLSELWDNNYNENSEFIITFNKNIKGKKVDKPETKKLLLVYENDKWLIDDFNDTKQEMIEYIKNLQQYFASEDWVKEYTSALENAEKGGHVDWKQNILKKVEAAEKYLESCNRNIGQ